MIAGGKYYRKNYLNEGLHMDQRPSNVPGMNTGFQYFAFISYKSEDAAWARWLKRQLQLYRLPAKTHRAHRNLPRRCGPIFLDKTNLTPGLLEAGLRSEVQCSRYLIVICSRHARANSRFLDEELSYFLGGGGDLSCVIPVIVDESKHPVEECFPARLAELCREREIVGVNIHDDGKRIALLKIIAAMLGLRREELESDDLRRRRKLCAVCTAAVLFLGCCGVWYWDYCREKTAYYLDYTEVYGVPQGIGRLKKEELPKTALRYAITKQKNRVIRLCCENTEGKLISHAVFSCDRTVSQAADHLIRPSCARYEYDRDGTLSKVTLCDSYEYPAFVLNYDTENILKIDKHGKAYGALSGEMEYRALSENCSKGYYYSLVYDENGFLSALNYCRQGQNPLMAAALDENGIGGLVFQRDELGRLTQIDYIYGFPFDSDSLFALKYKVSQNPGLKEKHAGDVQHVSLSYDADNNLRELRFLDADGGLMASQKGYAEIRNEYDNNHLLIRQSYFGPDGSPACDGRGVASIVPLYDERQRLTADTYYDPDGLLVGTREYTDRGMLLPDYTGLG